MGGVWFEQSCSESRGNFWGVFEMTEIMLSCLSGVFVSKGNVSSW